MANISTYTAKTTPVGGDSLIGTDSADGTTKNFTLSALGLAGTQSATSPDPTGGALTIATAGIALARVTPTANRAGVILQAGTVAGQAVTVVNEASAFTVTFAAAGTSNVSNGTACVIAAVTGQRFIWDSVAARWFPT